MTTDKVAITIDREVLKRLDRQVAERRFLNGSRAIQEAVGEKLTRLEHGRLAKEAAKLDRCLEQSMPEEGMQTEKERPEL